MSEVIDGTHVRMRVLRRYSRYNVGDVIVEFYAARDLAAKRLAQPLDLLVPVPAAASDAAPQSGPLRASTQAGLVRK